MNTSSSIRGRRNQAGDGACESFDADTAFRCPPVTVWDHMPEGRADRFMKFVRKGKAVEDKGKAVGDGPAKKVRR